MRSLAGRGGSRGNAAWSRFRRVLRTVGSAVVAICIVIGSIAFDVTPARAQPGQQDNPLSYDRNIKGLLRTYCYRCHNEAEPNGGVDLEAYLDPRMIARDPVVWRTVLAQIRSGEMPPEKAKQPKAEEREWMEQFIELTVGEFDCTATRDPGPTVLRRLNRPEYDRSIRELTGLDLGLSEDFSEDAISYGFRNIARSLTLSPPQVEQYFVAARQVVAALAAGSDRAEPRLDDSDPRRHAYRRTFQVGSDSARSESDASAAVDEREVARELLARFATRAFRRDVDDAFVQRLMGLYDEARRRELDHETSIGHGLTAILVSPRFLMRSETPQREDDEPFPLDNFDLASRLSFFLWTGPPDDELLQHARSGDLGDDDVLTRQLRRMLEDPRSDALIEHFFAAWLRFDALADHRPDVAVFPNWNDELARSVAEEPRRLLRHLILEDRPLGEWIDADYAMLDASLATHYGIEGVKGDEFRIVPLADRRRGGLLTTAALLMSQSDPGRTNVPRRGNFVASAILGTAPPPPPPDVPELPEDEESVATQTLRERLEIHRANPQCASCHDKIDPLGFALENYDAIGRWRDLEVGKPIDASGELPDGSRFSGPTQWKAILVGRQEELTRVLTEQLLIYALGRGLVLDDECVIEAAVVAARENEYRLSAILRTIVTSYPFRHARNPEF